METTTELQQQVDPIVWKACAGTSVHIPTVGSRVYYFPQGHAEQSSPPLPPLVLSHHSILCRVAAVCFLANPDTDEVFAKIRLVPIYDSRHPGELDRKRGRSVEEGDEEVAVVSFAKILTPSDANNGGGFSVPRFCADSIFPPLDFTADPPVQNILIRDVRGRDWEFRHIYRGTPRRHLLTTGWSKFVNHKKLIAGDSVVFMRKRNSGELFVGLRRAVRSNPDSGGRWNCPVGLGREKSEEEGGGKECFWRRGKGSVSAESVALAAEFAAQGLAFEVVYYPKVWWADFVVNAETVESSLSVCWSSGMRVKMAMETEDSSRITWFQGTVSSALVPDNDPWRGSPWRMLQVTWDEPELLKNMKRVSPWQVEYVVPTPQPHSTPPPAKKFRVPQNPGLADGDIFLPVTGLSNSMGNLKPFMNHNYSPAGMQGARQVPFSVSIFPNFLSENNHYTGCDKFCGNTMIPQLKMVSTELTIGSSLSDNLSPDSQSSVHFFGSVVGKKGGNSPEKVGLGSIQLFGKIILTKDAVDSSYDDVLCTEVNESPIFKEGRGVENPRLFHTENFLMGLMSNSKEPRAAEAYSL